MGGEKGWKDANNMEVRGKDRWTDNTGRRNGRREIEIHGGRRKNRKT